MHTLIKYQMENFHHCSHLPIFHLSLKGEVLEEIGHACSTYALPEHFQEPLFLSRQVSLLEKEPYTHVAIEEVHYYTLCSVKKETLTEGLFIIGPYTTKLENKAHLPFKPVHCIPHLLELLYLAPHIEQEATPSIGKMPQAADTKDDYSYHVIRAKQYIHSHYIEPITLEALATHLGIHKSYLCTIFKKVTKQSFCAYLTKVRLEKSQELLSTTHNSILDIALATGFNSASYFNTLFKKHFGLTPLEYRTKALQN